MIISKTIILINIDKLKAHLKEQKHNFNKLHTY